MQSPINSLHAGKEGEDIAKRFLEANGYSIVDCNWRIGKLEIDIVARCGDTIVFVEVKTRSGTDFGEPESFVNPAKQKHLIKAANAYLLERNINLEARFDIIAVLKNNNSHTVKHLPDAFRAWVR